MTDIEQQSAIELARIKAEKAQFDRIWVESLKIKAATFAHIPASALAYEMAWHGFRAGRASNGR